MHVNLHHSHTSAAGAAAGAATALNGGDGAARRKPAVVLNLGHRVLVACGLVDGESREESSVAYDEPGDCTEAIASDVRQVPDEGCGAASVLLPFTAAAARRVRSCWSDDLEP